MMPRCSGWPSGRFLLGILLILLCAPSAAADPKARLSAAGTAFVLTLPSGEKLTTPQLVGATLDMVDPDGQAVTARIASAVAAAERTSVMLLDLQVRSPDGSWQPMCEPDFKGRRLGFPVQGRWDGQHYVRDPSRWFLTCTGGSQGKCILWGYDPFTPGPGGRDLARWYQACQYMVRANYDGSGAGHTRNGTAIDIWDDIGLQKSETSADPAFAFEAGWGPHGAVCVARTRWSELLPLAVLLSSVPRLKAAPCNEAEARRRGALIFNRSKPGV